MVKQIYKLIIAFLIGAIYLRSLDVLQVKFGVEYYNTTLLSWIKIPLEFGILTTILSFLVPLFEKDFEKNKNIKPKLSEIIVERKIFLIPQIKENI